MKKTLAAFMILLISSGAILAGGENDDKRKHVWKTFHEVRFAKFGKFQHIQVYAENQGQSRICYMSDGVVYIFYYQDQNKDGASHIERSQHAKMTNPRINRITYAKSESKDIGFFHLWYYETLELSIGSS